MYRDKGKNYWISTEWGNDAFGHTGTRGMVKLTYNLINHIVLMPGYDTDRYPFPPPLELITKLYKEHLTMEESRMFEFRHADLIIFGSEERKDQLIPVVYQYPDENGEPIVEKKLVCCLDMETLNRLTHQLRTSQEQIYRKKRSNFPYPLREDVMDVEAYRFIDEIIRQNAILLPEKLRKSLELEDEGRSEND